MFILEAPLFLLLLLVIPTGIYMRHISPRRGGRIPFPMRVWNGSGPRLPKRLKVVLIAAHICFWMGTAGLIIALTGPGMAERNRIYMNRGIDIMLVVDVSPSMAARDFGKKTRLESTSQILHNFVNSRENDAIGVVAYGRNAALRLSPTIKHQAVHKTLDELQIFDHGDATAIGEALAVAVAHLEHSAAEHQAIVHITDGDKNAGEVSPQDAASLIGSAGIQFYNIGIGSEKPAPVEFVYPKTGTRFHGMLTQAYDRELLEEMADLSDGEVYTAGSHGVLSAVMDEIDSREVVERHVRIQVATNSLYRTVLIISFILLLGDFFIRKLLLREVL